MIGTAHLLREFPLGSPQSDDEMRQLRHVGTCDEAIQEIMAANLPPSCVVLSNNSTEATVSCWYHDLKILC
jgi:hypothetical protein